MKIINFQEAKEKKIKQKTDKEIITMMRNEIMSTCSYMVLKQYEIVIDKLENIYSKYKDKCNDTLNYINLYRFLGTVYNKINNKKISKKYFDKMLNLIYEYETYLLSNSPHTYILSLNDFYRYNKIHLLKDEKIKINKKIYSCASVNNFSSYLFLSEMRIKILEEQYIENISSLGIYNDINIYDVINQIKEEFKDIEVELNKIDYMTNNIEVTQ